MLDAALELIRKQLDAFLRSADANAQVILSNVVDPDGRPVAAASGKMVMTLANVTHAASSHNRLPAAGHTPAAAALDALVLFFANYAGDHYAEGLTALSRTIDFFERTPLISRANAPDLDAAIERVVVMPAAFNLAELASLIAMHGGRYLPSACYTLRLIPASLA